MAKGKKTGGRDFQPGHKLAKGRPQLPPDLKDAREANRVQFLEVANRLLKMSRQEIVNFASDPARPAFEVLVATVIVHGMKRGDHARLGFILDRTCGKEPELVNVNSKMGLMGLIKMLEEDE